MAITVKDAAGADTVVKTTDNAGTHTPHQNIDSLPASTNTIEVVGDEAHDAAAAGNPLLVGGYASAAAPASVSADADAVRAWYLRNGAQATVLTAAGALIGGDATNGIDVDVTRLPTLANVTTVGTVTNITNQGNLVDNAAFADGSSRIMMGGHIFDEVAGTALTENDAAASRIDSKRAQVFALEDATTRGQRQAVNAGGAAEIHGDIAHDTAVSGNPVRIGGRARTSDYTAVVDDDTTDLITDVNGKQITLPYSIPENFWQAVTAAKTDTNDTAIKAAGAAGIRNYITSLTVTNSHATVGTVVEVKDGSTVIHRAYAAPAGGGFTCTFPTPLKGTAATAVNVANITTGSNTYVSMSGYTAP
jgi:hypothetical protein